MPTVDAARQRREGAGADAPPLTILHLTAPARVGGLERVVLALAAGHVAAGHRVHVAAVLETEDPDHPFLRELEDAGVSVHPVVLGTRAYRRERAAVADLCRRIRPDVCHSHGYRSDVVAAPAARRLGIPTVATVHGFVRGAWRTRAYEWLQKRAYRGFSAVVAVARPQVEEIVAAGVPRGRVHLVPNAWSGRGSPLPAAEARSRLGVGAGDLHVGWVGRLSREKGADVLLAALPRLADLPLTVSFVGEGPERPALERLAREMGVAGRVRWHGFAPDAAPLFPAFDVFALSSRTEGTPVVLFEAVAAGVPVVAAGVGGVPDVLGPDGGLLVPPEAPAALADALRTALSDRAAARIRASTAATRLRDLYGASGWLDRHLELYRALRSGSVNR